MTRGLGVCCDALLREQPPFPVSPGAQSRYLDVDPVPASVGLARGFVADVLSPLDHDTRDVALLLTSELVTNAILHARTPVQVGVLIDNEQVLICVGDRMEASAELVPSGHSRTRPGGRGLALVADLSSMWGTQGYVGGKTVWFVLSALDAAGEEPNASVRVG
jgi:anti-sigma regulatory factor (Ser/Thr protein kinase)